jgi:hypothetical protein
MGLPCDATVKNKGPCDIANPGMPDPTCFQTCGPLRSGIKNCSCTAGMWNCPVCGYDPAANFSCFRPPAVTSACPPDPTKPPDPSGMNLPQNGDGCSLPVCTPCGSASGSAYRDAVGAPKIGFCVCSTEGVYSCASINEWPPV